MARKCQLCNQIIEDGAETILYKNRYVHLECFNHIMSDISKETQQETKHREQVKKEKAKREKEEKQLEKAKIKPIEDVKDALSEEEFKAKKQYYAYLREQLGDVLAKHYVMTEKYIKQFGFTFAQMYNTLVYLHDVLDKVFDIENGNIISLIPYYYEEADAYYKDIEACDKANKGKNINEMYKVQTVKVTREKRKRGETWEF